MQRNILVPLLILAFVACALMARAADPQHFAIDGVIDKDANKGSENAEVGKFDLALGDYVFIGLDTGSKGKDPLEIRTIPLEADRVRPDAVEGKWTLKISVWPDKTTRNEQQWKIRVVLEGQTKDGAFPFIDRTYRDMPENQKATSPALIRLLDRTKDTAIDGLRVFKVPYAMVDGEEHNLVFAIGNKPELFPKAIQVPRTYIMYTKWDNWERVPISMPTTAPATGPK